MTVLNEAMRKKKKYQIGICGGFDNSIINGQALRTISITDRIVSILGSEHVSIVKYANWKKRPFALLFEYLRQIRQCEALIVCPDERAIRFIIPIAGFFSRFRKTKVFYVVIGGWLPVFLKKHRFLRKRLTKIDGLFVQTETLKKQLGECGLSKVFILPNFRNHASELKTSKSTEGGAVKTFFLSRIEDPKGVEEMIGVVKNVNRDKVRCTLDIFGSVMPEYKEKFETLAAEFPEYIKYRGELKSEKINGVIWEYDLQLFPTKYRTEGFPGSILDAFYAGVPTLSAKWYSGSEVINDGVDGVLFEQFDFADMENKLTALCDDSALLNRLKEGARLRGEQYDGDKIVRKMLATVQGESDGVS